LETATLPLEQTWKLEDIFGDDDAFERAKLALETDLPALDALAGRLSESAGRLADVLEEHSDVVQRFALLRCYAALRSDADTRVESYQVMRQSVELLATELSRKTAFVRPEILALEPETIEGFINVEPRLAPFSHYLRDLARQREHVLGPNEEQILAESSLLSRSPSSLYQVLSSVELPRPEATLSTGETIELTPVNFNRHRSSQTREDRLAIFPSYFRAYRDFKSTFGHNLYASIKGQMFRARVRRYDSCLAAALSPDNVPVDVYRNLIRQVHEHLPVLHRYIGLRARALGLDRVEYPDLYCPMTSAPARKFTPEEARRLVQECQAPLGDAYTRPLGAAFDERWIDWHPGPGKRSGAYATGWAYDVHPFVLLNYVGDYESVSTLAHEMGHAMHSYFSNRTQLFPAADYPIFVAEVASTLNEALLNHHMLEAAGSREEKLALVGSYLDGIRGTLFRQTMFAEFELEIHERAERGEVLTGEKLSEIYLRLLRLYHGHDEGVMHVADDYAVEWAAIPHLYYDFYVYQYSTGIVAATALAHNLLADSSGAARERYMQFLSSGGTDYPLELLRRAGVDLEMAQPYRDTMASVSSRLDLLETLL